MSHAALALVDGVPWDMHRPLRVERPDDTEKAPLKLEFLHYTDRDPKIANSVSVTLWIGLTFVLFPVVHGDSGAYCCTCAGEGAYPDQSRGYSHLSRPPSLCKHCSPCAHTKQPAFVPVELLGCSSFSRSDPRRHSFPPINPI